MSDAALSLAANAIDAFCADKGALPAFVTSASIVRSGERLYVVAVAECATEVAP